MDCSCDKALLDGTRGLLKQLNGTGPASTLAMARAVVGYFTIAPCVCRERKFCTPTCGFRTGCRWGGPQCRQATSPGLGGVCALKK
jgi:hypothetical protein